MDCYPCVSMKKRMFEVFLVGINYFGFNPGVCLFSFCCTVSGRGQYSFLLYRHWQSPHHVSVIGLHTPLVVHLRLDALCVCTLHSVNRWGILPFALAFTFDLCACLRLSDYSYRVRCLLCFNFNLTCRICLNQTNELLLVSAIHTIVVSNTACILCLHVNCVHRGLITQRQLSRWPTPSDLDANHYFEPNPKL